MFQFVFDLLFDSFTKINDDVLELLSLCLIELRFPR